MYPASCIHIFYQESVDLRLEKGKIVLAFFSSGCNQSNLSTFQTAKLYKIFLPAHHINFL